MDQLAKVKGALLGVAVGDALGATLEFMTRDEIQRRYGIHKEIIGQGYWRLAAGDVTDDTDMTVAVARGILTDPANPLEHIARNFADWAKSDPQDIGKICSLVLQEGIKRGAVNEAEWLEVAEYAHYQSGGRSGGNGSLMRTIPVALAYCGDRERMLDIALRQSALTHYDPLAGRCVMLYCDLVRNILLGRDLKTAIIELCGKGWHGSADMPVFEDNSAGLKLRYDLQQENIRTTGYVLHTLEAALNCAYQTGSFEEALIMAVNLGGDTDTIGAVTGGLAGAFYGLEAIPERWLAKLRVKDELLDLAERLSGLYLL